LLKMGVALHEFFCSAAGKSDGEAAVVFVAFNADDRADTVFRMADALAEQRIRVAAATRGGTAEA
jgi:hypothetical protein